MPMMRVYLEAPDGDSLVLYYPVDADGVLDKEGPSPWLFRGTWGGKLYTGELEVDEDDGFTLYWSNDMVTPIELPHGLVLVERDRTVVIHPREGRFIFTVRDTNRV